MKHIKDVLTVALLGTALFCMVAVAAHLPGWCRGFDNVQARAQNTAGNLEYTTKAVAFGIPPLMNSLDQGGQKMQRAFDSVQLAADKSTDVLDNVRDTTGELIDMAGSGTKLIDHTTARLDVTVPKIDAAIDAVAKVPPHAIPVLDNSAILLGSLNDFAADKKTAALRDNASLFLGNSAKLIGDANKSFFPGPYTGNHPKVHMGIEIGKGILGVGGHIAEPAYYGKGVLGK